MTRRSVSRMIGILVVIMTLCGNMIMVRASDEQPFNLLDYCETHEIGTQTEFNEILVTCCNISEEELDPDLGWDFFKIDVDREIESVIVMKMDRLIASGEVTTSNSASKEYFNQSGNKIFTIRVEGTFMYTIGWCTCISSSGSFLKPLFSPWNSTPSITSGNTSATKSYARISGTATYFNQSKDYTLTLTCNNTGTFGCY